MSQGSRRRARIVGTSAERALVNIQTLEIGSEYFETDTSNTYKVIVAAGLPLPTTLTYAWLLLGNSASSGGSWTTFAGAGPHTVTDAMGNVLVSPGAGVDALVTLPDLATYADVTDLTIVMVGGGVGASVALTPVAGQTISNPTASRFFEGGAVILRANRAALAWEVASLTPGLPDGVDMFISATGSDTANGTSAAPLLTLDEAARRIGASGYTNYCHYQHAAGTYVLASNAVVSLPCGTGDTSEPPVILGTAVDSGLGSRTTSGATNGSGSTFATVTDSAGGLVVNAWKGYILRYTSGAQINKEFVIASNTANVFTLCGSQTSPVNGTTFVVLAPGTIYRSGNGVIGFTNAGSEIIGARFVQFDSQSIASSGVSMRGAQLYPSACWFTNQASIQVNYDGGLFPMFSAQSTQIRVVFPSLSILQTVGSYFVSAVGSASMFNARGANIDVQNSLINGLAISVTTGTFQAVNTGFQGTASVRAQQGANIQLGSCRFETVTAVAGDYATAAIVLDAGASGSVQNVDVSNCTGIALSISCGLSVKVQGLAGSLNAGVPVSILRGSALVKSSANSVTGAVAGNDVQIGGNAATTAWAAVNAGVVTDQAAAASQFCIASN